MRIIIAAAAALLFSATSASASDQTKESIGLTLASIGVIVVAAPPGEVNHVFHCPEPAKRRCTRQKVVGAVLAVAGAVLLVDAWFMPDEIRIEQQGFAVAKRISW